MIAIPDLIWSGVVGALGGAAVALVTTWLNNREQNKRQKQQLDHDAEQRTRQLQHDASQRKLQFEHDAEQHRTDRQMGLRREIYLEAAMATGKMQEFIASYARQDLSESDKLAIIQGAPASLNKIHIIGTNRTIEAFSAVQETFGQSSLRLGKVQIDVKSKEIDIEQDKRHLQLLEERRKYLHARARELGPTPAPEVVNKVHGALQEVDDNLEVTSHSLDKNQRNLFVLQMALAREGVTSSLEMLATFSEAVLAVREEMQLGLDVNTYKFFVKTQQEKAAAAFREFIEDISKKTLVEGAQPSNPQIVTDKINKYDK